MKFSEIKAVKEFCEGLFSTPDWKEVIQQVLDGEEDFEVDNVRFIAASEIDAVLTSELESDAYVLGCFNTDAIVKATGWPSALIDAAKNGEAFEALGQAIIDEGYAESLAEIYSSSDGYGHHFNSYDGNEEEVTINGIAFHVFDNH